MAFDKQVLGMYVRNWQRSFPHKIAIALEYTLNASTITAIRLHFNGSAMARLLPSPFVFQTHRWIRSQSVDSDGDYYQPFTQ
jgi:hypothetical protein